MKSTWTVEFTKKAAKAAQKLRKRQREILFALVMDIQSSGPVRGDWPNYSKLSDGSHHCHLDYAHVACWNLKDGKVRIVEIYYVGSRKDAPYD